MHELVIRGGTVIDGTGAPGFTADVAIAGGKIVEIGKIRGSAVQVIDGRDLVAAPGFVDPHTHFDAQLCWDPLLTPSSWHGVTTVVLGNCGVGIAPCKPDAKSREIATRDLVTVEQIPYDVLNEGISWQWTSFPEFMRATARRGCALNTGFIAPLTPFRHFVMGEESLERSATPAETQAIKALIKDAVTAGALGFSLTRIPTHLGYKGLPLAAQLASREELTAYCHGLRELDKGCVELAVAPTGDIPAQGYELLELVVKESGRPVTWLSLLDRDDMPDAPAHALQMTQALTQRGAFPQVSARPLTVEITLKNPLLLAMSLPSMQRLKGSSVAELLRVYRDAEFRRAFRADLQTPRLFSGRWDLMTVQSYRNPQLKPFARRQVADIAQERNQDPVDTFFDLALEDELELQYNYEALNTCEERVSKLITDPRTMIGLSDAGAHVDMLCDASYTTYMLGHWVRERGALTLEHAVKRLTSEPADFFGLHDRGRLQVGMAADVVIFDPRTVGSARRPPIVRHDLPGGGHRMITPARGIEYTIVNGEILYMNGQHTGALPGRVLGLQ